MPLLQSDPLSDPTLGLDSRVNPFVARLKAGAADGSLPLYYGPSLAECRGHWAAKLQSRRQAAGLASRVVLEIGCHKGTVLLPLARNHPEWAVLGLDITFKRVVTTAERLGAAQLSHAAAIYANAQVLDRVFAPGELGGVLLFFPDPWSKKAHQIHRRLVNADFVQRLLPLLAPGAFVWVKTDAADYLSAVGPLFAAGLQPVTSLEALGLADYKSSYELRFQAVGTPTYSALWQKPE